MTDPAGIRSVQEGELSGVAAPLRPADTTPVAPGIQPVGTPEHPIDPDE